MVDYVREKFRGRAWAITTLAGVIGQFLVIFAFLDPLETMAFHWHYWIPSLIFFGLSLVPLVLISDFGFKE